MTEKLQKLYFDPKTGFTGASELVRRSGVKPHVVKQFLHQQDTYTKHKDIRKKFPTRRVVVNNIDQQYQVDLVEMIPYAKDNKGYKYILTCIDVFSKYLWAIPIKSKSAENTAEALAKVFAERVPKMMQSDHGKEFENKTVQALLTKHGVRFFTTNSEFKAQVVERVNRTLKTRMWRYFTEKGHKKWIDVLQDLVHNYNTSFHRSIGMTPAEASLKKNEDVVRYNLYGQNDQDHRNPKFEVGDSVRIAKWKSPFSKAYAGNYTTEQFFVTDVLDTQPVTYRVKDWHDEPVMGTFYEQQLVKYDKQDKEYEIEEVIKTRTKNGKKQYFVKWKGYGDEFNSWVTQLGQ